KALPIRVEPGRIAQWPVTPEQHHRSGLVGWQMGLDADDTMQPLGQLLRPERQVVYLGLARFRPYEGWPGGRGSRVVRPLLAIFAVWAPPPVRALIGQRASGMLPPRREQRLAPLSAHWPGIVRTACPLEQHVPAREGIAERRAPPLARP